MDRIVDRHRQIDVIFRKIGAQILHAVFIPMFLAAFVIVYRPERLMDLLDTGRGMAPFNLTMLACITLLTLVLTRTVFYLMRHIRLSEGWYMVWCIGEVLITAHFWALYLFLMHARSIGWIEVMSRCQGWSLCTEIYPYLIINLSLALSAKSRRTAAETRENQPVMMRFMDENGIQKLVVSSDAVLYIEAAENYIHIHYLDSGKLRDYQLRASMRSIESLCASGGLVRCHRSFYVSASHVNALRKDKDGIIMADLDCGEAGRIPVSKTYYDRLSEMLK